MTRPTFAQWRDNSTPIYDVNQNVLIPAQTPIDRILAALASYTLRKNPDGTSF